MHMSCHCETECFAAQSTLGGRGRGGEGGLSLPRVEFYNRLNDLSLLFSLARRGVPLASRLKGAYNIDMDHFDDDGEIGRPLMGIPLLPTSAPPPPQIEVGQTDRSVSDAIDRLLKASGIPLTEVAKRLEVRPQTVDQYRSGRRSKPSVAWLVRLAAAVGARVVIQFPATSGRP